MIEIPHRDYFTLIASVTLDELPLELHSSGIEDLLPGKVIEFCCYEANELVEF